MIDQPPHDPTLDPKVTPTAPHEERRTIQSVERALDILEVLATGTDEMRLNEIARAAHLNISTCHHLITTLLDRGYVGQNPRGRTYFLGNKTLELSRSRAAMIDLVKTALPALRALNQSTGETVSLDVLRGSDLVTLAMIESRHAVRVALDEGAKAEAAHATGSGKSILAWVPETELSRIIEEKGLRRFTEHTICSKDELIENLRLVRRNGYAIVREEFQPGVLCIGSAIRDHTGAVIGALCCALPTLRATDDAVARVCSEVKAAAVSLSLQLGGEPSALANELRPGRLPPERNTAA
ncbi:IclR family transcriptional regulator [Blastochloris tepida]|uniref:IclR family transcriptional regulator n=1 Tax=Blastochloris tepida TaxID=2233851 RepID=A0A348G1T0_9HYPH|nr:IclR family transcriptional regulator [Blastochloris tepida]BBF93513.1 IclR family transcriptional regulator [Blastochloris tepida]